MGVDQSKQQSKHKVLGANSSWNDNFQLFMTSAGETTQIKNKDTDNNNEALHND